MRTTACSAAVLGGLLALLLLPGVVSAHQITNVDVDCVDKSIQISGDSFGGDEGVDVTVTVSGPDGYLQTFIAKARVAWTVSLPLGPSGDYTIRWSDPEAGEATFTVDCPEESLSTPTPAPTPGQPTAKPPKTPDHHGPTSPHATLPPTDTRAPSSAVARTDTILATLGFIAVFAAAVAVRRTAQRRTWRR